MSRPRLAVLVPSLDGGGAERVVVNLLRGFARHDLDIDLLLVNARGPLLDEVPAGVSVVPLRGNRVAATLPGLVAYLRRRRPDALLSHLETMNVMALLARRLSGVPVRTVVTTHVLASTHARRGSWRQRTATRLMRSVYPWADAVVGVSKGVVDDLQAQVGHDRIRTEVIYNPIVSADLAERALGPSGRRETEAAFAADGPLILAVGRLVPQKNHRLLVEAFSRVVRDLPRARLVVLGEGPERVALERQAAMLGLGGAVSLPGFVRDPTPWYRCASVLVLSSSWEGFGNVLVEALLFGCPVVSTRCRSGPEEILAGGRYGRLVPVDDPDAMAEAILETLTRAVDVDRDGLRQRALEFDVERSVEAYLALLFPGTTATDAE